MNHLQVSYLLGFIFHHKFIWTFLILLINILKFSYLSFSLQINGDAKGVKQFTYDNAPVAPPHPPHQPLTPRTPRGGITPRTPRSKTPAAPKSGPTPTQTPHAPPRVRQQQQPTTTPRGPPQRAFGVKRSPSQSMDTGDDDHPQTERNSSAGKRKKGEYVIIPMFNGENSLILYTYAYGEIYLIMYPNYRLHAQLWLPKLCT